MYCINLYRHHESIFKSIYFCNKFEPFNLIIQVNSNIDNRLIGFSLRYSLSVELFHDITGTKVHVISRGHCTSPWIPLCHDFLGKIRKFRFHSNRISLVVPEYSGFDICRAKTCCNGNLSVVGSMISLYSKMHHTIWPQLLFCNIIKKDRGMIGNLFLHCEPWNYIDQYGWYC